ncbi:reverse transcriptase domain-containing protein [Marinobacter salarius]|uniref:reverse transcriptase domain-containing protein n=1 Tax=Marinobacter salarius TaxID=1420917 RepID=UPI0029432DF6|nr:reverse transcriptase domain-containing protein [Marinobacter salarius]WOI19235.1 reverse transcriptase domain-containing protein [Marinobacter salarius]WOI20396.1 reverse transcriptase domain-containing protein [Marinobacter salarius]
MRKYYSLYGQLLSKQRLYEAFRHIKRNKGAAGIDGQSLSAFEADLEVELSCLLLELKEKRYRAQPVRRVAIAKDDGGERLLGIPTVRDRVVQQALRSIIEPIFEPDFHPSSYGYRPGRSGHHAIGKAERFIRRYRRDWVVDMDLSKCFDTLNHDLIIRQFRQRITDGSVLSLLRQCLESGVMVGYHLEDTELGSPQGGVISPLIANVLSGRLRPVHEGAGSPDRPLCGRHPDPVRFTSGRGECVTGGPKLPGREAEADG